MKKRVEEHRPVTGGEDEAVTVCPEGIPWIVPQVVLPQGVRHRRRAHGEARMAGICLLDRIHGERADCIDGEGIHTGGFGGVGHDDLLDDEGGDWGRVRSPGHWLLCKMAAGTPEIGCVAWRHATYRAACGPRQQTRLLSHAGEATFERGGRPDRGEKEACVQVKR